MASILAAIDLSTIATAIAGAGVVIVGIALAFKAVDIGKRSVNKA